MSGESVSDAVRKSVTKGAVWSLIISVALWLTVDDIIAEMLSAVVTSPSSEWVPVANPMKPDGFGSAPTLYRAEFSDAVCFYVDGSLSCVPVAPAPKDTLDDT